MASGRSPSAFPSAKSQLTGSAYRTKRWLMVARSSFHWAPQIEEICQSRHAAGEVTSDSLPPCNRVFALTASSVEARIPFVRAARAINCLSVKSLENWSIPYWTHHVFRFASSTRCSRGTPKGTVWNAASTSDHVGLQTVRSKSVGRRNSLSLGPDVATEVRIRPSRPALPSNWRSSSVMIALQHVQRTPDRDMVPSPIRLSCSRRCALLPPDFGIESSMANETLERSVVGCIRSNTR